MWIFFYFAKLSITQYKGLQIYRVTYLTCGEPKGPFGVPKGPLGVPTGPLGVPKGTVPLGVPEL